MVIGILKKAQPLQSLIGTYMSLSLSIFLAVGLNSGHVTMVMEASQVGYGSLYLRVNNLLSTESYT